MKNFSFTLGYVLLSLTLVLGCRPKEESAKTQKPALTPKLLAFACEGGKSFTVQFDGKGESVILKMDDTSIKLLHVPSGTGAKYSDGRTTVWMKGDEALVEVEAKLSSEIAGSKSNSAFTKKQSETEK